VHFLQTFDVIMNRVSTEPRYYNKHIGCAYENQLLL